MIVQSSISVQFLLALNLALGLARRSTQKLPDVPFPHQIAAPYLCGLGETCPVQVEAVWDLSACDSAARRLSQLVNHSLTSCTWVSDATHQPHLPVPTPLPSLLSLCPWALKCLGTTGALNCEQYDKPFCPSVASVKMNLVHLTGVSHLGLSFTWSVEEGGCDIMRSSILATVAGNQEDYHGSAVPS